MININCPERSAIDDLANIISEKYSGDVKTILQRLKHQIVNRYSDYSKIELNQRLEAANYSEQERNALKHLYVSQTATAKKIVDAVSRTQLIAQAGCCVSCGIGDADQIDHFLPQEHFPEYSIMHKNLLPVCGACNEIKGDNIPGLIRNYFHPMFDKLPDEPFLGCQITYTSGIPTSNFSVLAKFQSLIIGQHFTDLKLKARLEKKATQYFLQVKACKNEFGDAFAIEEIHRDKTKLGAFFGTNYWKYILCNEMVVTDFIGQI